MILRNLMEDFIDKIDKIGKMFYKHEKVWYNKATEVAL